VRLHIFFDSLLIFDCLLTTRVLILFLLAVVPPPCKDDKYKPILERLKAVREEERSIKFLLKNEHLHKYGLLDPSRSLPSRSIPHVPSPQTDTLTTPPSADEPGPSESDTEAALKKCSTPAEGAGLTGKAPLPSITEEGEISEHTGEEQIVAKKEQVIEGEERDVQDVNVDVSLPVEHESDYSNIFSGLGDITHILPETFKDTTSQLSSAAAGTALSLPNTPQAKKPASTEKATSPSKLKPKSGSLRVVCTLHTFRTHHFAVFTPSLLCPSTFFFIDL